MGDILQQALGMKNNFRPNNGGQDFGNAIQSAQGGINNNIQNQGNLAQALMMQSSGAGPNPALAMLNQTTDQNIKQNAAMLASQKGINAGATQRQVALNAANQGQQAVGQAASLGAQQQLAAQGQLANVYGQIGAEHQTNQNAYQGQLANENNLNAGVAASNTAAAGQLVGGLVSGAASGGAGLALKKADGGKIPGQASVPGDSEKNDTVHTMLSPGEIVIPRSKASDPAKAKEFIDHVMGAQKNKGDGPSFAEIAKLKARIASLEKKVKA